MEGLNESGVGERISVNNCDGSSVVGMRRDVKKHTDNRFLKDLQKLDQLERSGQTELLFEPLKKLCTHYAVQGEKQKARDALGRILKNVISTVKKTMDTALGSGIPEMPLLEIGGFLDYIKDMSRLESPFVLLGNWSTIVRFVLVDFAGFAESAVMRRKDKYMESLKLRIDVDKKTIPNLVLQHECQLSRFFCLDRVYSLGLEVCFDEFRDQADEVETGTGTSESVYRAEYMYFGDVLSLLIFKSRCIGMQMFDFGVDILEHAPIYLYMDMEKRDFASFRDLPCMNRSCFSYSHLLIKEKYPRLRELEEIYGFYFSLGRLVSRFEELASDTLQYSESLCTESENLNNQGSKFGLSMYSVGRTSVLAYRVLCVFVLNCEEMDSRLGVLSSGGLAMFGGIGQRTRSFFSYCRNVGKRNGVGMDGFVHPENVCMDSDFYLGFVAFVRCTESLEDEKSVGSCGLRDVDVEFPFVLKKSAGFFSERQKDADVGSFVGLKMESDRIFSLFLTLNKTESVSLRNLFSLAQNVQNIIATIDGQYNGALLMMWIMIEIQCYYRISLMADVTKEKGDCRSFGLASLCLILTMHKRVQNMLDGRRVFLYEFIPVWRYSRKIRNYVALSLEGLGYFYYVEMREKSRDMDEMLVDSQQTVVIDKRCFRRAYDCSFKAVSMFGCGFLGLAEYVLIKLLFIKWQSAQCVEERSELLICLVKRLSGIRIPGCTNFMLLRLKGSLLINYPDLFAVGEFTNHTVGAIACLQAALRIVKTDMASWRLLAQAYEANGQLAGAAKSYGRCLEIVTEKHRDMKIMNKEEEFFVLKICFLLVKIRKFDESSRILSTALSLGKDIFGVGEESCEFWMGCDLVLGNQESVLTPYFDMLFLETLMEKARMELCVGELSSVVVTVGILFDRFASIIKQGCVENVLKLFGDFMFFVNECHRRLCCVQNGLESVSGKRDELELLLENCSCVLVGVFSDSIKKGMDDLESANNKDILEIVHASVVVSAVGFELDVFSLVSCRLAMLSFFNRLLRRLGNGGNSDESWLDMSVSLLSFSRDLGEWKGMRSDRGLVGEVREGISKFTLVVLRGVACWSLEAHDAWRLNSSVSVSTWFCLGKWMFSNNRLVLAQHCFFMALERASCVEEAADIYALLTFLFFRCGAFEKAKEASLRAKLSNSYQRDVDVFMQLFSRTTG